MMRAFSCALPTYSTPSLFLNFRKYFWVISSLRWPFSKVMRSTASSDELFNVVNERLSHRCDGRRGGKPLAPVYPQVFHHAAYRLQGRHVDVEIHPVDRLVLKHHMIT